MAEKKKGFSMFKPAVFLPQNISIHPFFLGVIAKAIDTDAATRFPFLSLFLAHP